MKQLSAAAIRALCDIKAQERMDAQRDLDKAEKAFQKKAKELDDEHRRKVEADADAKAEVDAHKDYLKPKGPVELGEMTRQEYDEEHRALEAGAKAAKDQLDKSRDHIQETLAPFRKTWTEADKLVQDLTRQWKAHERKANEAGIDISACWTPDRPLPDEPKPLDATAPAPEA